MPPKVINLFPDSFDIKNPPLVFSIPHEKWYYRSGTTWDLANPVGKTGAEMYLVSNGWTTGQAKHFLKALEYHTAVYGAELLPNQGPIGIDDSDRPVLNLWVPPTLVPSPGPFPTIERVLNHVTDGDAEGRRWLEHWMALKVQKPDVVPKVAAIFATSQGGGKGFLARVMAEILGEDNCAIVKQNELGNNFNKRWIRKLFILGDEVISNENVKDISQLLKILVDGGQVELEAKYENQVAVRSRLAWMFASNDRISPLALEDSDRRYTFFTNFSVVPPDYTAQMDACFEPDRVRLTEAFKREIAGFAAHLLSLQVDEASVRKPYKNAARAALIEANLQSHETFCAEVDEHGIDPLLESAKMRDASLVTSDPAEWDFGENGIATSALYKVYRVFCKDSGQYPLKLNKFGAALKHYQSKAHPGSWRQALNTIPKSGGRQARCYVVPRTPKPA